MSNENGNPHYEAAEKRLDGVHDWQAEEGATDATMQAAALDALTEATLALAFEQRTANLIALHQMAVTAIQNGAANDGLDLRRSSDEIEARLGLNGDQS